MKVSRLIRGNGIVRQYSRMKEAAIVKGTCATAMFAAGAVSAIQHRPAMTFLGGFMSCMYVKELEIYLNLARSLKPEVDEIVNRAKSIYRKK